MGKTLLEIQGLKKSYGRKEGETKALNGVSFQVLEGEFLGIMGSSGSGKTTLLNCIATMIKPTEGKVLLAGEDISTFKGKKLAQFRGKEIGYLFQDFELLDNLTVEENILLPSAIHGDDQKQAERKCMELAKYLDMQEVLDKFPSQISGGQKQRAVFEEKVIGHAEVRQIFKASGVGNIAGSYVLDGIFQRNCKVRISREGEQIFEGELASLKRFKDDVKEVKAGYECGLVFEDFNDIKEEDRVEAYIMVEVPR